MIDRADFEKRMAAAIKRGLVKHRVFILDNEAATKGRQVADALPGLFTDASVLLGGPLSLYGG